MRKLLRESGALREGHFELSSGLHSSGYVQCALLLELPARARQVGEWLASRLAAHGPDSVLSPALGGLIIGHETAASLGVPFRFVERREGSFTLRRGFHLQAGERVAVVEDVVTTGRSTQEAASVARGLGAEVVAFGAIVDRGTGSGFNAPFEALLRLDLPAWEAAACPLCARGTDTESPGSRR
ncbi:MAG: orotate phosphoribosyltransferase [Thermoanaerobaculia bacterium]